MQTSYRSVITKGSFANFTGNQRLLKVLADWPQSTVMGLIMEQGLHIVGWPA